MKTIDKLYNIIDTKGAAFFVLIDPDKIKGKKLAQFVSICEESGVDGFLVGGSLMISGSLPETINNIKDNCNLPVIIFPGDLNQVVPFGDALLYFH